VRDIFQKLAEQIDGEGFLNAIPLLKTSHLKRYPLTLRNESEIILVSFSMEGN
jgi:hypothetical protein